MLYHWLFLYRFREGVKPNMTRDDVASPERNFPNQIFLVVDPAGLGIDFYVPPLLLWNWASRENTSMELRNSEKVLMTRLVWLLKVSSPTNSLGVI